jgi:uncharacterized protein (DUF486 family)
MLLLIFSNLFMTLAWYGHLHWKKLGFFSKLGILGSIIFSWLVAFFEYIFQVPANKIGYKGNGGPFNLFQLKTLQEVISLAVFTMVSVFIFKSEKFQWNHLVGFLFLVAAVYFVFKKW